MRRRAILLAGALALTASACIIYTGNPARDPRVLEGLGMRGRVYLRETGAYVTGELLTGDSTGYLLIDAADGRVKWIPAALAAQLWFPVWSLRYEVPTTADHFAGLREASRFMYGMAPEALAAVLSQRGQPSVDTMGPSNRTAPPNDPTAAFLGASRKATERYRSADAAAADGFKRVGTEFPFMGEHWVNLPRVLENRFDAASPAILIYVVTAKGRELAGVGYSALLGRGEQPPASVAPAAAWHEHNGAVVDESRPGHHGASHGAVSDSMRLAVLHAWTWVTNPAGAFVTDNEALPLFRRGSVDARIDPIALRGLTLAQDSAGYYAQVLRAELAPTDSEARMIVATLAQQGELASRALAGRRPDEIALRHAWESLWTRLAGELPQRSAQLGDIRRRLQPAAH